MAYTAYTVVTGAGIDGINKAVTSAITAGQQPFGGVIQIPGTSTYAQVMVTGSADSGSESSYTLPAATASALGGVKLVANQANAGSSSATDVTTLVSDFNTLATKYNALLAALETAGVMAASS